MKNNLFFKITFNNLKGPLIVLHHGWLKVIRFTQRFYQNQSTDVRRCLETQIKNTVVIIRMEMLNVAIFKNISFLGKIF